LLLDTVLYPRYTVAMIQQDIILLSPTEEHGPAFSALTDKQKRFVLACLMLGDSNDAEAIRMAGYDTHLEKQMGFSLSRNPKIIAAKREEADRRLKGGALLAASALMAIVRNPIHPDHFKATKELLNRSGFPTVTQHNISVEHRDMTDIEKDHRIIALCKELGLGDSETRKMLIGPETIDAEYTEVDPDLAEMMGYGSQ
jgi:hypothetical protein